MFQITKPVIFKFDLPNYKNKYIFYKVSLVKPYSSVTQTNPNGLIYVGKTFSNNNTFEFNISNILKDFAYNDNIAPYLTDEQKYLPKYTNCSLTTSQVISSVECSNYTENNYKFRYILVKVEVFSNNTFTTKLGQDTKLVSNIFLPQNKNFVEEPIDIKGSLQPYKDIQNVQGTTSKIVPHFPLIDTDNYFSSFDILLSEKYIKNYAVFGIGVNPTSCYRFFSIGSGVNQINLPLSKLSQLNYDVIQYVNVPIPIIDCADASVQVETNISCGGAGVVVTNVITGGNANVNEYETVETTVKDYNVYVMNQNELINPNGSNVIKKRIAQIDECPKKFYVGWQNESGAFMSFGFDGKSYSKLDKSHTNITNMYDFRHNVKTKVKEGYIVTSGILNDDEYNEIQSIFSSKWIYIYDVDKDKGSYVTLTTNSYEHKKYSTEKKALYIQLEFENCENINL